MLVFAISDKGGTGRSVTSCNLAYRLSLKGKNVAYVDFDFGSPTAGALFEIGGKERGVPGGIGLHSYLLDLNGVASQFDVRATTDRIDLRKVSARAGRLVLFPGDEGGAEFATIDDGMVQRCADLLVALEDEFKVSIVDLSAGRSVAAQLVLKATTLPQLRLKTVRWLVFHRWTRQHIVAANGLVHGPHGLVHTGTEYGHDRAKLLGSIRYVRTAVGDPNRGDGSGGPAQATWVQEQNRALRDLANRNQLGSSATLGITPIEPVLLWREQIILDKDVTAKIANAETAVAFSELARRLDDSASWERV
ncbi:SCO2523 family variant P-loop protein [Nocardia sp. NPDC050710]|uniref:SCO2523 family variant P-loop protein n=1 Tax=Nocardia sp. NPDC050710 TaxID=3157220 RepID=UPI0033FD8680